MKLSIDTTLIERLEGYLESLYPDEAAGLLLGRSANQQQGEIMEIITLPNNFEEGERYHRYTIDPMDMLRAENAAVALDMEVLGVFHSHPDHPARPSDYDLEYALPWFVYVITSIRQGNAEQTLAWQLQEDRSAFQEVQINIKHMNKE
ncbi:MAG: M67 family metallopeptidase [Anaerolineales bacterium]|nr:M67 family metallopeptidase [Anaerolineales bacterium]